MRPEDQPVQHFSLKNRIASWISQNVFDNITYTVGHGHLKGLRRKGGLGWLPEWLVGSEDTPETRFLTSLDLSGKVVYDIGAFHGIWSLLFARKAREVICFEPNSRNRSRLTANVELNGLKNVRVIDCGIGDTQSEMVMAWDSLAPGGATIVAAKPKPAGGTQQQEQIRISTLDHEVEREHLPAPDFVKMDIEGYELKALQGARSVLQNSFPTLFIELHGNTMREKTENAAAVISLLTSFGYPHIRHVESGTVVSPENAAVAARGHLLCSRAALQ